MLKGDTLLAIDLHHLGFAALQFPHRREFAQLFTIQRIVEDDFITRDKIAFDIGSLRLCQHVRKRARKNEQ